VGVFSCSAPRARGKTTSIDDVTTQLRSQLQEAFGVDGAAYLMDRPPGGWSDLVTNDSLDRKLAQLEARLDEKFDLKLETLEYKLRSNMDRELRAQTWYLMTAMLSSMAVLVAVMVAAVKL
jgi:hypothetical protein